MGPTVKVDQHDKASHKNLFLLCQWSRLSQESRTSPKNIIEYQMTYQQTLKMMQWKVDGLSNKVTDMLKVENIDIVNI